MTTNQIAYWNLQEQIRTNKANEAIKGDTLDETRRSNVTKELEAYRSNKAKEAETARHNKQTETLEGVKLVSQNMKNAGDMAVKLVDALIPL